MCILIINKDTHEDIGGPGGILFPMNSHNVYDIVQCFSHYPNGDIFIQIAACTVVMVLHTQCSWRDKFLTK